MAEINVTVNGRSTRNDVEPRMLLVHYLRETLGLVLRLPVTLVAAAWFGIEGAAAARALTGLAIIAINLHIARRLVGPTIIEQVQNCGRSLIGVLVMAIGLTALQAIAPAPTDHAALAAWLAAMVAMGGVLHISAQLVLWNLAGRPQGPERLAVDVARELLSGLRRARFG